jgi:hypothetical protein
MTDLPTDPVEPGADAAHPGIETLADLAEELLAPAAAATVRAHLAHCPECADTLAALAEVTALLADAPVEPMPAEVALRIDAALAAEPLPGPRPPAAQAPDTRSPSGPLPSAGTGPGRESAGPRGRSDRSSRPAAARPRRRRLLLAAAACLAVLGLGGAGLALSGAGRPQTTAVEAGQRPLGAAGPEFTADGLPEQIHHLLPAEGPAAQPHASAQQNEAGALPDCVQQVLGPSGQPPLLIAHGSYQGAPVDVYVLRIPADPTRLNVLLLTPGCTTAAATVRLQEQVPAR